MISFIILNYKSLTDTLNCIDSIFNIKTDYKKSIIVVDNNSTSLEEQLLLKEKKVDSIFLEQNVGFSRGNNIGCEFAIEKYNPDFLCVINSDIIISQSDFINQIYELYDLYNFDVLGPKILPENSESSNPFPAYKTLEKIDERISYTKKILFIYKNFFLRNLMAFYLKYKNIFVPQKLPKIVNFDVVGEPLHGCALIFSKKYYRKYKNVFCNEMFLFHEEEFLYHRCIKDGLIFLYSPRIELIHLEGQSLNKEFKKNYKKVIFKNKKILESLMILKNILEGEK